VRVCVSTCRELLGNEIMKLQKNCLHLDGILLGTHLGHDNQLIFGREAKYIHNTTLHCIHSLVAYS
jgi:hypothetical protein